MKARRFSQVDVFTDRAYQGNPVAVVMNAEGLEAAQMQAFTDWTNLSEATFLLPPTQAGADYRLRIFCPGRELPFAGHPTLGSCHAWLEAGGRPQHDEIVQECEAGLVRIRRDGSRLAFGAPDLQRSDSLGDAEVVQVSRLLGIDRSDILRHAWCDNGPPWQGVMLRSAEQVLSLRPESRLLEGRFVGVVGPYDADGSECAFEVRAFFPGANGLTEDPVTGSLNAALAQWLIGEGLAPPRYIASQGTALGRAGRVHIEQDAQGRTWVGGDSVTCIEGSVLL